MIEKASTDIIVVTHVNRVNNYIETSKVKILEVLLQRSRVHKYYTQDKDGDPKLRFKNLENSDELKIFIAKLGNTLENSKEEELVLPRGMLSRLKIYFKKPKKIEEHYRGISGHNLDFFDCHDFTYYLKGVTNKHVNEEYKLLESISEIKIGEIYQLWNPKDAYGFHRVLYVGGGIFLSKLGQLPITFTGIEGLRESYNFNRISRVILKEKE